MIEGKVIELPGAVKPVALGDGATVADALNAASMSADGFTIKVDDNDATLETTLSDGFRVILSKGAKGNA